MIKKPYDKSCFKPLIVKKPTCCCVPPHSSSQVNYIVPHFNEEASPIARLIGADGKGTVGWVYAWESSELSILWIKKPDAVAFIDPEICAEQLEKSKATTSEDVIALLARYLELGL